MFIHLWIEVIFKILSTVKKQKSVFFSTHFTLFSHGFCLILFFFSSLFVYIHWVLYTCKTLCLVLRRNFHSQFHTLPTLYSLFKQMITFLLKDESVLKFMKKNHSFWSLNTTLLVLRHVSFYKDDEIQQHVFVVCDIFWFCYAASVFCWWSCFQWWYIRLNCV